MIDANLPLTEVFHPATFRARGVALPCTSPLLAAARVREDETYGIEVLVPNPSGGRGVYIVSAKAIRAICTPTVHDVMLLNRILSLPSIDPARVREAALMVERDGYGGHDTARAARLTIERDQTQRLLSHFQFMVGLVRQVEPDQVSSDDFAGRTPDFDRRASTVLNKIAPALGSTGTVLADGVAALGDAFAQVGLSADGGSARIPRLVGALETMRASLEAWLADEVTHDIGGLGQTLLAGLKAALDGGDVLLARTRGLAGEALDLMRRWVADPNSALGLVTRCDWFLDGWERIALLWQAATTTSARKAALIEMAQLLPVLPPEALEWTQLSLSVEAMEPAARIVSHEDTWRRGSAAFGLVGRNEALRAMSQ